MKNIFLEIRETVKFTQSLFLTPYWCLDFLVGEYSTIVVFFKNFFGSALNIANAMRTQ